MVVTYWAAGGGENDEDIRVIGDKVPVTDPGLDSLMAS